MRRFGKITIIHLRVIILSYIKKSVQTDVRIYIYVDTYF